MLDRLRSLPPVWLVVPALVAGAVLARAPADEQIPAASRSVSERAAGPAAGRGGTRPSVSAPRAASASPSAPAASRRTARRGSSTTPLVAVTHPTRRPIDLDGSTLVGLLGGRVSSWRALGEPPRRLRVIVAPEAAAAAFWLWLLADRAPAVRVLSGPAAVSAVAADRDALAIVGADAAGPSVRTLTLAGNDPLLGPNSYPLRVPGASAGRVTTALAVGDILLGRTVHRKMVARGDFTAPFADTREQLSGADLAFANFECTIAPGARPLPGGTRFTSVPAGIRGLQQAGLDVLSLANNHTGDYGRETLTGTGDLLNEAGIQTIGAGANDTAARKPAILVRNGVRFGFLSFNAIVGTQAPGEDTPGAVRIKMAPWFPFDPADLELLVADVRTLRAKVDVLIVYPHWGVEYTNVANDDQRRVGRALIDAGADMVIGTHPHWVQGAEIYKGRLIAYSLGNFVFDQTWSQETQEAAALQLVFWDKELKRAEFIPVRIADAYRPRFVSWRGGLNILQRIWRGSGAPYALGAAD